MHTKEEIKMKARNRFLAVLLTLCMVLFSVTAYADSTTQSDASRKITKIEITNVKLDYKVGEAPTKTGSVPEDANYEIQWTGWALRDEGASTSSASWTSNGSATAIKQFEKGKKYTYIVAVQPKAGYTLPADKAELTITINGTEYKEIYHYAPGAGNFAMYGPSMTPSEAQQQAPAPSTPAPVPPAPTCPPIIPGTYTITKGAKGIWAKGSSGSLSFTVNADIHKFVGVMVDGCYISDKCYTVSSGSTIVRLKNGYLNSLPVGVHSLTVVFEDGMCGTQFGIRSAYKKNAAGVGMPKTGDNSNLGMWVALMVVSAGIATATVLVDRKKKLQNR